MGNSFADYKVLEGQPFTLKFRNSSPNGTLYKSMSFSLPQSYVEGTNFAMPMLQFVVRARQPNSRLVIFVNTTPTYGNGALLDLTHNGNKVVYDTHHDPHPARMLSAFFTGTRLQAGSNNIAFATEERDQIKLDNIALFYQRNLP